MRERSTDSVLHRQTYGVLVALAVAILSFLATVLLNYEPHHSGFLAGGWPLTWPQSFKSLIAGAGVLGLYTIMERSGMPLKSLFFACGVFVSSVGVFISLAEPSLGLVQWACFMLILVLLSQWWERFSSGTYVKPIINLSMGLLLGSLASFIGLLPAFLAWSLALVITGSSGSSALRTLVGSAKPLMVSAIIAFSLISFFQMLQGNIDGWHVINYGISLPFNYVEYTGILLVNSFIYILPWHYLLGLVGFNALRYWGHSGSEKLFNSSAKPYTNIWQYWATVCLLLLVTTCLSKYEPTMVLLLISSLLSWILGYAFSAIESLQKTFTSLQIIIGIMAVTILIYGFVGLWNILTLLPDEYISDVLWLLPGSPILNQNVSFLGTVSIPIWKSWLLIVPGLWLIASLLFGILGFTANRSLTRTLTTLILFALVNNLALFWVLWPVTHPPMSIKPLLNSELDTKTTFVAKHTLLPYQSAAQHLRKPYLNNKPYWIVTPEHLAYTERFRRDRNAVALLKTPYWGLSEASWVYFSMADSLTLFQPVPLFQNRIILRLNSDQSN